MNIKIYTDDDYRENYLKRQKKGPVGVVILDDNPLSLACYMEDHPEIDFEDSSDLSFEERMNMALFLEKYQGESWKIKN